MRRPSLSIIVPKSCQTCHEVLIRSESDIFRPFRPSNPIRTSHKPSRKQDTYDSETTHLPHGMGSQRPHSEPENGDIMGTSNPTRTLQERFGRREDVLQDIAVQQVASCRTGVPTRHSAYGQPDGYGTFIGHMSHRTRRQPAMKQDINRTFERAAYGHKGQGNGSQRAQTAHANAPQTHQTPHPNGPDMGQRGQNRATNTPIAPRITRKGLIA